MKSFFATLFYGAVFAATVAAVAGNHRDRLPIASPIDETVPPSAALQPAEFAGFTVRP